jgi:hypothetical protein
MLVEDLEEAAKRLRVAAEPAGNRGQVSLSSVALRKTGP